MYEFHCIISIKEEALWVCEVSIKCFLSPLFSMSGLSWVRSGSLLEPFCILTIHSLRISRVCTENGWGCFITHADTIIVLMNLYLSWKNVFGLLMLLFVDFFFFLKKTNKLWDSVEVLCHALWIFGCIVKKRLYMSIAIDEPIIKLIINSFKSFLFCFVFFTSVQQIISLWCDLYEIIYIIF